MARIITISRQFGSGGRTIGKEVAERLRIPCYDSEILEKVVEASGFSRDYVEERGEYLSGKSSFFQAFVDRDYNGHSIQDDIFMIQQEVILDLAKSPCVFVGRCADYILRDRNDCLKVFIHADMESRARRIVEQYGEKSDSPMKRLKDKDSRRAAYYQFYTDMKWGDVRNYHIALDSGSLGIHKCVDILENLWKTF